jgi:hypothetical protein
MSRKQKTGFIGSNSEMRGSWVARTKERSVTFILRNEAANWKSMKDAATLG